MLLALTCILTFSSTVAIDAATPRLLSGSLSETELRGLLRAVAGSTAPFAIRVHGSQTLPYFVYADVFLTPTNAASAVGVTRGTVVHLKCRTEPGVECTSEWQTAELASPYARIHAAREAPSHASDRVEPFELNGQFSDEDLVSLVAFVRTSPNPPMPPGSFATGIDGTLAITLVEKNQDGTVNVYLSKDDRSGQRGTFKKSKRGWTLIEACCGVG